MARTSTLAELIAQVRARTDQEVDSAVDDASHLTPWINNGIAAAFEELTKANPDWYLLTDTIVTTAGTLEYALPADFMLMRGVEYNHGRATIEVHEFAWGERNRGFSVPPSFQSVRYRVIRNGIAGDGVRIAFRPDPGARTYTIHYVPNPPELALGADAFDGIAGFEEFVIEFACIKVRVKQEEDPTPHERALAYERERIQGLAHQRDVSGSSHVARVRPRRFSRARGVLF